LAGAGQILREPVDALPLVNTVGLVVAYM